MTKKAIGMFRAIGISCFLCFLVLMTGCDTGDSSLQKDVTIYISSQSSGARTILPTEYPTPVKYHLSLTSTTGGPAVAPVEIDHSSNVQATFSDVYVGSYTLLVNAYSDAAKTKLIFTSSQEVNVTASGSNAFTANLTPITSSDGQGTISINFDWSQTGRTVTHIQMLLSDGSTDTDTGALVFNTSMEKVAVPAENATTSYLFSQDLPAGLNQYVTFKLWNGDELVGSSGVDIAHVYQNITSTSSSAKNYIFSSIDFQPASGVKQASVVPSTGNSGIGLDVAWTNPIGTSHQVITWKNTTEGSTEEGSHTTAATDTSYTISNLQVNTTYLVKIKTYYSEGYQSAEVPFSATTIVPAQSVSMTGIADSDKQAFVPGSSFKLVPIVASTIEGETATDLGYTWTASDENVAMVLADGTVVAKKIGSSTITVTTKNGNKTASVAMDVYLPKPISSATADDTGITIAWNAITNAESYDVYKGNDKLSTVTTAEGNTSYSVVDNHLVSGTAYSYSVVARATVGNVAYDSLSSVATTGIQPAAPSISITLPTAAADITDGIFMNGEDPIVFNLVEGDPSLKIEVSPVADAQSYQWFINNYPLAAATDTPYIAYVTTSSKGLNKAVMDNVLSLQVTGADGMKYIAKTKLYYVAVKEISVTYTGMTSVKTTDGTVQLTANVSPANATIQNVSWSFVDPTAAASIATITDDGKFTALDSGTVAVKMTTHHGYTNTQDIVCTVPVAGVAIATPTANGIHFINGENGYGATTLSASVISATTGKAATNQSLVWSTSNADVLSVDQNGLITPITAGTARITVTTMDGGFQATYDVSTVKIMITKGGVDITGGSFNNGYNGWVGSRPSSTLAIGYLPTDFAKAGITYQWTVTGSSSQIDSGATEQTCTMSKNGANAATMYVTCTISKDGTKVVQLKTTGVS